MPSQCDGATAAIRFSENIRPTPAVLEAPIAAARRLYLPGVQEVGATLRTAGRQIFAGIHIESATGFATICGEVAALCTMVARDTVTWRRSRRCSAAPMMGYTCCRPAGAAAS